MNLLIVADAYPTPDRNAADLRLTELLGMLAEEHEVFFCAIGEGRQVDAIGNADVRRYREGLQARGGSVVEGGVTKALRARQYAVVMFEWYFTARDLIDEVRVSQPAARIIVDSVDVVFNRLEAKARVTRPLPMWPRRPRRRARSSQPTTRPTSSSPLPTRTRRSCIARTRHRDVQHSDHPPAPRARRHPRAARQAADLHRKLVRPGGETNIDAMTYFCGEIFPLIVNAEPDVRLRIIGSSPPGEIAALASDHVEVLGFVPEVKPFLETSAISIAPLRFGGGIKGKIGEAMSLGLPVVTTSTGIEGFGLQPGIDALVADNPGDFAGAVIRLLRDRRYLEQVRMAGHRFIGNHFSDRAVKRRVDTLLAQLDSYPVKRMALAPIWLRRAKEQWERHVGWRLK